MSHFFAIFSALSRSLSYLAWSVSYHSFLIGGRDMLNVHKTISHILPRTWLDILFQIPLQLDVALCQCWTN